MLTPAMTLGMEERVPDLERVVIEDCGHWTQQETPAETTAAMLAYLRRLDPGTLRTAVNSRPSRCPAHGSGVAYDPA